ncbi:serine hydrolase [Salininema proteolyticum]|uniref:Serine hydrolase n=1 Tax=Salininema proteolyticum TaxID=1607685 RepID=A0ABV8U6K7_9ACTN
MRLNRRLVLGGAAATAFSLLTTSEAMAQTTVREGPPTAGPGDVRFPRKPFTLREGTPEEAGLLREHVDRIVPSVARHLEGPEPSFPGFAVLAARDGVIALHEAAGHRSRYSSWDAENSEAVELPREEWEPMTVDTVFDFASVTKLFTAVLAARFYEDGLLDPDDRVADHLLDFADLDPDKAPITVRHLLSHTSGMIAFLPLWREEDDEARWREIRSYPLDRAPGAGYGYSDLNMITLAAILEKLSGTGLDALVARYITEPLGMADTGFNPPDPGRCAPTEYQPWTERGMVRGSVHDENAWGYGGVAGHAGLFGTARDLAVFGQMILNGGSYGGARVLSEASARLVFTDMNAEHGTGTERGWGWQLNQRWYMDALNSPVTAGHTGYTGTSLVLDPLSGTLAVVLSNRVHPTREWGTVSVYRRAAHRPLARALAVEPQNGETSWYSGQSDGRTVTLEAPLPQAVGSGAVLFRLWTDTESTDVGSLAAEVNGEWRNVPLSLKAGPWRWEVGGTWSGYAGRRWAKAEGDLPAGTRRLRWSYASDSYYQGRGVYVDSLRVKDGGRTVFDSDDPRDEARLVAEGWERSRD